MSDSNYLDFLSIQVRDLDLSKKYYTDVLGFKLAAFQPQNHAVVFESDGGVTFAIRLPIGELDPSARLGTGVAPWFSTGNIDALFENIQKHNGKLLQEQPQPGPFGRFFITIDPDGYALTFHEAKN